MVLPLEGLQALQGPFVSGIGASRNRLVVLRGPGGRRRIMLDDGSWSPAVLDEGLLPWAYRHPWLTVLGAVVVLLVVSGVLISLVPVPASR